MIYLLLIYYIGWCFPVYIAFWRRIDRFYDFVPFCLVMGLFPPLWAHTWTLAFLESAKKGEEE